MSVWEEEDFEHSLFCPHCSKPMVKPTGRRDSLALMVVDAPFDADLVSGSPFSGPMGQLMETELSFQQIRMRDLRRMTLWTHAPNGSKECFEHGVHMVIREAVDRKLILLVGAETVRFFTKLSVDACSGLVVQSEYFPTHVLVACPSPKSVFSSSVGEIRFALTTFKRQLEAVYAG